MGKHVAELPPETQSRDWQITIPRAPAGQVDKDGTSIDYAPEDIIKAFKAMGWSYWIFSEEIGAENGLDHYQCFVQHGNSPIALKTIRSKFRKCGIVNSRGESYAMLLPRSQATVQSRIDYCSKSETHKAGPWTGGEPDLREHQGKRTDLALLKEGVDKGLSFEQMMVDPTYMYHMTGAHADWVRRYIESKRIVDAEQIRKTGQWDDVTGFYIWGDAGAGKTTWVMEHAADDLYVAAGAKHPFDRYAGQGSILIDEFHHGGGGAYDTDTVLKMCDKFRLPLDARYHDVTPQWTRVFLTSNLAPQDQFRFVSAEQRPALARRIKSWHFTADDRGAGLDRLDELEQLPISE